MPSIDLYLRKSTRDRDGVRALTFRAQEARGREWAEQHGYSVRHVWRDNLSAWSETRRPDFDKALAALAAGEADALWVYALDRWSRKGAGSVVGILDAGRRLIADYERLDSAEPRDRRRIIDAAEQAREYSDLLSYRVRGTKRQQREEGAWVGLVPYGLRTVDRSRKLHHDPVPWHIVLMIFRAIANGVSSRAMARRLNAARIPSPSGKATWRAGMVQKIIRHPVYEGLQVEAAEGNSRVSRPYRDAKGQRVSVLADGVTPVPSPLVLTARLSLDGRTPNSQKSAGRATTLLAGLVRCAGCDGSMASTGVSYRCGRVAAGAPCDAPAMAQVSVLDDYAVTAWAARLSNADETDPLLVVVAKRWEALTRPTESAGAREAAAYLSAAEAGRERLLRDRQAGLYDGADALFFELHSEALRELESAQEAAAKHSIGAVDIAFLLDGNYLREAWEDADLPMRRDLLRLAVGRVTVAKAERPGAKFDGPARVDIAWLA
ncbi:recombinase family protein [Streptomyces sp. NPDC005283]|uniref:recombinase family protein n=1 Tax=Streptomyces sp. NPDC005283 TaxID=3156871 RepID=UPI0034548BD4